MNTATINRVTRALTTVSGRRKLARARAYNASLDAGLDDDTADACTRRCVESWHPDLTDREYAALVREEIQRHAQP